MSNNKNQKSRLHDEKGNLVSTKNIVLHLLPAFSSGMGRVLFNYRPQLPWISYTAIKEIRKHLNMNSIVLEFGSGMSTLWFSKYVKQIYSVEDNKAWFDKLSKIINIKKIRNVTYRYLTEIDYFTFMSDQEIKFDLILVDGSFRDQCIKHAINNLKEGGILYLDNSDKYPFISETAIIPVVGNIRFAEKMILEYSKNNNCITKYFTDFAPTQFFVQQGLMLKNKSSNKD